MDGSENKGGREAAGKDEVLEHVMAEHESPLLRYATRILRDPSAAQDVVQDTFIRFSRHLRNGSQPPTQLRAWLYRVTHNGAVDYIRRESRLRQLHEKQAEQVEHSVPPGQGQRLEKDERMQMVSKSGVEPAEQQVVVLRLQEGLSYREIAHITKRSEGNVGCILHHAVRQLSGSLKKAGVMDMSGHDPCRQVEEQLTSYLLGDLPAPQAKEVKCHVETCERCRASLQELKPTLDLLQDALAADAGNPARLDPARRERVLRGSRRRVLVELFGHPRALVNAAAVLLVLGVMVALLVPTSQRTLHTAKLNAGSLASQEVASHRGQDSDRFERGGEAEKAVDALRSHEVNSGVAEEMGMAAIQSFDESEETLSVDTAWYGRKSVEHSPAVPAEGAPVAEQIRELTEADAAAGYSFMESEPASGGAMGFAGDKVRGASRSASDLKQVAGSAGVDIVVGKEARAKGLDDGLTVANRRTRTVDFFGVADVDSVATQDRLWADADVDSSSVSGTLRADRGASDERPSPAVARPTVTTRPARNRAPVPEAPALQVEALVAGQEVDDAEWAYQRERLAESRMAAGVPEVSESGSREPALKADTTLGGVRLEDRQVGRRNELARLGDGNGDKAYGGFLEEGKAVAEYQLGTDLHDADDRVEKSKRKPDGRADVSRGIEVDAPSAVPMGEPADGLDEAAPVFRAWGVNPFVDARNHPLSTFGIDVDTASYTLARKHMLAGFLPPPEAVRTEEFINFFDYGYRAPSRGTFAISTAFAPAPFGEGYLLKIGVKGRRLGREEQRRAALTFVIDTSGSMETPDRLGLIQEALRMLVAQLGPEDTVSIVQYDSRARLALEATPAARRERILEVVDGLQTSGSTHLEDGLQLGYEIAARHFDGAAMNRVLLLSDGMANMGSAEADPILDRVASFREQGIYCSVFGFGRGTYNDVMLETLGNRGDGTYQFIDSLREARRVFVDDLAATLNVIARDVKIQVAFDPAQVERYRQLGYENRAARAEDFRNDTVDAGEVGSGQSVTALYEVLPTAAGQGTLGTVRVRYRRADNGEVEEIARVITASDLCRDFEQSGARFKLAAGVAEFAEILRGSPFSAGSSYEDVARVLRPVALELDLDQRVSRELLRLVQSAPGLPRVAD